VQPQQLRQIAPDRHLPALATLALADGDHALGEADVLDPELHQFGRSGAGFQQGLQHQAGAAVLCVGLVQEAQLLLDVQPVDAAAAWSHARRPYFDFHAATKSPIAAEALARIAALYAIEAEIRGQSAATRQAVRQEKSRPLLAAMHAWLTAQLNRLAKGSSLAKAIRYTLHHWGGLLRFLDDGKIFNAEGS
jgi:hypothetical protein